MRLVVLALLLVCACEPPGWNKKPTVDGGDGDGMVTVDAPPDSAPGCDHVFRLDGQATASSVWLTGDFVQWAGDPQAGAVPLSLGADGGWTGTYHFPPGMHQYKFIVDGTQWIADPTNPNQIDDGFGGKNSVYDCMP